MEVLWARNNACMYVLDARPCAFKEDASSRKPRAYNTVKPIIPLESRRLQLGRVDIT